MKCQTGWITSWNQDCREKYQSPQICRWHHPYGRKWRGTLKFLDEGERGEWKSWLESQYQKIKIMASSPITSFQIDGGKWKWWQILFSWAPKSLQVLTTAKKLRHSLLWRKTMRSLDSVIRRRDNTLPTKVHIVKAVVFPVIMNGCESWTIKRTEH